MKNIRSFCLKKTIFTLIIILVTISFLFQSCKKQHKENQKETNTDNVSEEKELIEIVTENMDFQMPDTISSGWNTFRYKNLSSQTHFFLVEKYPNGKTSKDAKQVIAPVFESAMKLIMEGKTKQGYAEFSNLPEWYSEVKLLGGSGLVSPNQIGQTTLNLKPGKYVIECYIKMSNGVFHTSMGMVKDLVVSNTDSGKNEPKPDIEIDISSTEGIVLNDSITSGTQTFSVKFKNQIAHENFVGHDINLVSLGINADLIELEKWMNWTNPEGLKEPAPKGVTFIGGVNDMPEGEKGYFTAILKPGEYALISEVPNAISKNMLKRFAVYN